MVRVLSVIGKNIAQIDSVEIVTGAKKFVDDIELPNMVYGKLLRSPYPHAKIVKVDVSKAKAHPGVLAVVTSKDAPAKKFNLAAHSHFDPKTFPCDQRVFDEEVRYIGEPVAGVVAEDEETAEEATELIEVVYEELPAVFDPEEAMETGAPLVHSELKSNIVSSFGLDIGDIKKGFKDSDYVVEGSFSIQRAKHCQLEPIGSIALFDNIIQKLTVWTPSQNPHIVKLLLAELFSLHHSAVEIISTPIGGSFGVRLGMSNEPWTAALAKKVPGRPVKLVFSREEDFIGSEHRHAMKFKCRLGAKKDGTFLSYYVKAIADTGAYATHGPGIIRVCTSAVPGMYKIPNIKYEAYCVYTNNPVAGASRGYGAEQGFAAIESLIDMMAETLEMDPIELRLKNSVRVGDTNPLVPSYKITSFGIEEVFQRGAKEIGWKRRGGTSRSGDTIKRGMGVASHMWVSGTRGQPSHIDYSNALIKSNPDGTFELIVGCPDQGTGVRTSLVQIAAEALGVLPKDIKLREVNTNYSPFDIGTHASRTTYTVGEAVRKAALEAKKQILKIAADKLRVSLEDLEVKDGKIYVKTEPTKVLSISEICDFAHREKQVQIIGMGVSQDYNAPPCTAHFAEVEVDVETGVVKVLKMVVAHDIGRIINPYAAENNLIGGVVQGIGYALSEEMIIQNGDVINANFSDYKLLRAVDIPEVKVIFVETVDPTGPFGAKAVGECGLNSAVPAILNAIHNAIGVRINELPASPERVMRAIDKNPRYGKFKPTLCTGLLQGCEKLRYRDSC